jgi:hypothetical protein
MAAGRSLILGLVVVLLVVGGLAALLLKLMKLLALVGVGAIVLLAVAIFVKAKA